MKKLLKLIGIAIIAVGVMNVVFMMDIYGVCGREMNGIRLTCFSFDDYANQKYILLMGGIGFISLTISGILFLGFSKVIELLEDIRELNKND